MSDYENLVAEFVQQYPNLVLEMSGPWSEPGDSDASDQWICNFKDRAMGLRHVHSGSPGRTLLEALQNGMDYLEFINTASVEASEACKP